MYKKDREQRYSFDEEHYQVKGEKLFSESRIYYGKVEPGETAYIRVPKTIGKNSCRKLIEFEIDFPKEFPAVELKDTSTQVSDLNFKVCKDIVIVDGVLHKSISYKTFEGTYSYKYRGFSERALYGTLKNLSLSLPFSCFLEVSGAGPCDEIAVSFAGVEDSCESDVLGSPFIAPGSEVKVYRSLKEKVVVRVDLRVLRQVYIKMSPPHNNSCEDGQWAY